MREVSDRLVSLDPAVRDRAAGGDGRTRAGRRRLELGLRARRRPRGRARGPRLRHRQGLTAGNTTAGIARNPGAAGAKFTNFILGMVLIESIAIYGLVIAFMLQGKI